MMFRQTCRGVIVVMALFALASPALADCGDVPVVMTGTLREVHAVHPNGTAIDAFQIVADVPVQAIGVLSDGCVAAQIVQLVPLDAAATTGLAARLGQMVKVTSPDVFEAHTAWHIGDAVAMDVTLAQD
jgi:hypothetical protein